jgi:hypothetical protein
MVVRGSGFAPGRRARHGEDQGPLREPGFRSTDTQPRGTITLGVVTLFHTRGRSLAEPAEASRWIAVARLEPEHFSAWEPARPRICSPRPGLCLRCR